MALRVLIDLGLSSNEEPATALGGIGLRKPGVADFLEIGLRKRLFGYAAAEGITAQRAVERLLEYALARYDAEVSSDVAGAAEAS